LPEFGHGMTNSSYFNRWAYMSRIHMNLRCSIAVSTYPMTERRDIMKADRYDRCVLMYSGRKLWWLHMI
jgi:hypothetical protein